MRSLKLHSLLMLLVSSLVLHAQSPQVASASPASGPVGTSVQINGSGFGASQGSSTVAFNGVNATVSSWSDGQITAAVPFVATGPVTVKVGSTTSNNNVYFVVPPPQITSISPTTGIVGTQVTITGSGFGPSQGSSCVAFKAYCVTVNSWSATQIVATVSSNSSSGPVIVVVNGVYANEDVLFTVPNPVVASVSPTSGPVGTQVQINGSGFGAVQGSNTIAFNGAAATVSSWSDSQIVATVPSAGTSGPVVVTISGYGSNSNVYFSVPPPQVTSISPTSGPVGTSVTVSGSGFQATQGSSSIAINGHNATVTSWSNTQIGATVASGTTTGPVKVTVSGVPSNQDVVFSTPNPVVTSVSPDSGAGRTQVQINGVGFGATQGSSTVYIGGYNCAITSWSATQIVATVDSRAQTTAVIVTVGGVQSNQDIIFTVVPPTVTSISPTSGSVGTQVTITGVNFQTSQPSSPSVYFNGQTASTSSWNSTQIVATVPSGATTGPVVVSTNTYALLNSNENVIFTMPSPVVSSLTPSAGPAGTQVQINGKGFGATQGSTTLTFNGSAAGIVSWSDTQIVATVPSAASTGPVTVTEGGVASNSGITFTVAPPQVSSISPASGVVGTQVTINGNNFQATRPAQGYAYFNGSSASIVSWSNTQIVANAPSATSGGVKVCVNSMCSNADSEFTYPNPVLNAVSPSTGPAGSQFQLSGSGFGATQGSSYISFNGVHPSVVSWSDSQIVATVPSVSSAWMEVTVGGVSSSSVFFTVQNVSVSSVSPSAGPTGTQVTVNGTGFGSTQGSSTLSFNGTAATSISSWTNTQIVATIPTGATTGSVKVVSGGGTSNTDVKFTVGSVYVSGINPASGEAGSQVTINGSGFGSSQGSSTVSIAGNNCPSIVSWSSTQIVAVTPGVATTGAVKVVVGGVASNADVSFSILAPNVAGLVPSLGPAGTQVQINGAYFGASQGSGTVTFNGNSASVVSWSDTQITAAVPASASTGPVVVKADGVTGNNNVYFTVPAPQITSISPSSGVVGTQVTITGSGFGATQGSSYVRFFNAGNSAIVSWSDGQIVATVPGGAISGAVYAHVNGVNSNQDIEFSMPRPAVASISPVSGPVGTQIQVNGSGFGATQGSSTIAVGSTSATVVSWSDTQIVATVPSTATVSAVVVTEGGVGSNSNVYFSVPAPQVSSISPTSGLGGTQVTITGSGFQATQGSSSISFFSGSNTVNSWSDTQIVATTGSNVSSGAVKVTVNGVVSNQDVLFTVPKPVINGLSPGSGPVGTQVQINGVGFGASQGSSTVAFYGETASPAITSWSDTQIVATVPTSAFTGGVTVTVGGTASNNNIIFTIPPPQITSLSPTSGVVGTQLTINGSGFQATRANNSYYYVTINGTTAAITSWSDSQIVATVPAQASTGPVRVYTNSVVSNQNFEFAMPAPFIADLSPTSGPVGTQVTVNGSGFGATQGTTSIAFSTSNGTSGAPTVLSWSDTQITMVVPAVAVSGPVTITEGGVGSNGDVNFTVPPPQITSITPNLAGSGHTVTVAGSGFQASQTNASGRSSLTFTNGVVASISSWSDTQIVATVPSGSVTGPVKVNVNGEISNLVNYTIPGNLVTSVSPTSGPVGTQVTVSGTGFGATQGSSTLAFDGQLPSAISSWSNTQIVATVPVTAASGPAAVTVGGIQSNIDVWFNVPPPAVNSFSPGGGVAGTQVTITGSGFQASQRNSTLTFNGVTATASSWSDTQIVATVPVSATTGPMLVTVNAVPSSSSNTFTVPNPVITAVNPPCGPTGGTYTITGSGFTQTLGAVYINGTQQPVVNANTQGQTPMWSDTSITILAGAGGGTTTSGPLTVQIYDATSNSVPFTVSTPSVSSVSPDEGPVGSTVTITGSGFCSTQSGSTVSLGGTNLNVTSWNDTQIVGTVSPGTSTGPVFFTIGSVEGTGTGTAPMRFKLNTTATVTDSLGNSSTYKSVKLEGTWHSESATGSGCSSCTVRGSITNSFDWFGDLLTHTDELGHVITYTYDASSNVVSQSQQLDANTPVTTSYTYNSFGEPLTVTDPLGNVTTNTYDASGNLLTVSAPPPVANGAPSVTSFAYDAKGELTQITDPLSNITKLTYSPVGLISSITDAQNNVTSYGYDQHGNRTSVTDALNHQTTFAYDAGDRLTSITYPDQSTVSFAYDVRGRRTSVTDQNGKTTSYAYDDADRLTSVTDAAGNVTQYAYDTENNLLSITDANLHTTSFQYDAFGRVTQTSFPSTAIETYLYDAGSNLTSKTDRKGNSILYVYDALNRLTHKGYPDSTGVDYVYDLAGKIKQVSDPTGTYTMAYDNMGRLIGTTTTYSFLPSVPFTNSYVYDLNSNRTQLSLPDGSTDVYHYDTLNRLSSITDSLTGQFNFGYDGLSRRTSLTRPNGVNTSYGYDSLSRLLSVLHQNGTNTLDGAIYTYDAAGNRTAKSNLLNNITENYTYDAIYQLTQVVQGATTTESYSYDAVGNRLSSLGMSYNYNTSNELTSTSVATYTYDANGNTLSKTDSTGTRNYTWDFENRLTSVVLPGSGGTVTFKYDPFGRRIQKTFAQGSTTTVTNYVYDGANSIEEVDANGNLLGRYAQGAGIDEPLSELRSGTSAFYQQDGLGSITSLTNSTAAMNNSYTYDTFGNITASSGSFVNPYVFTGRDHDAETGLRYYRARYYDPALGRFLSGDPLEFASGGANFYGYVGNRPLNEVDPSGMAGQNPITAWWNGIGRNSNFAWNWFWETDNFGDATHIQFNGKDFLYYGTNTPETQDMMNSAGGLYMQMLYRFYYKCKGSPQNNNFATWAGYLFTTYDPSNAAFQVGAFSFDINDMGDGTVMYTMYNKAGWYSLTGGLNRGKGDHDRQPDDPMHEVHQFGGNVRQMFQWRGAKPCGCENK